MKCINPCYIQRLKHRLKTVIVSKGTCKMYSAAITGYAYEKSVLIGLIFQGYVSSDCPLNCL